MGLISRVSSRTYRNFFIDIKMSSRQKKRLLKGEDDLAHLRALESPEEDDQFTVKKVHNKKSNKSFRNLMTGFAALEEDNGSPSETEEIATISQQQSSPPAQNSS